jgi:hypothetical protein
LTTVSEEGGKLLRLLLGGVQHGPGTIEAQIRNFDSLATYEAGRNQHAGRDQPNTDSMSCGYALAGNQC